MGAPMLAVADGPTEVHKVQVAQALLKNATPAPGLFPREYLPHKRPAARARYKPLFDDTSSPRRRFTADVAPTQHEPGEPTRPQIPRNHTHPPSPPPSDPPCRRPPPVYPERPVYWPV